MLNNAAIIKKLTALSRPKIVVLTGAGISAESGIKTFRDGNGLWENHSIDQVATPEGFTANPNLVYRFYNQRRQQLLSANVQANLAHHALAHLEILLADRLTIVTQNVDNLHEEAGSERVLHMHGSLISAKCIGTGQAIAAKHDIDTDSRCSCCKPAKTMRPDIVWFGEIPYFMDEIEQHLFEADLFVSIGTSGNVYPAAGFVSFANNSGTYSVELNLEPSEGASQFDEQHNGPACELVPAFVEQIKRLIAT